MHMFLYQAHLYTYSVIYCRTLPCVIKPRCMHWFYSEKKVLWSWDLQGARSHWKDYPSCQSFLHSKETSSSFKTGFLFHSQPGAWVLYWVAGRSHTKLGSLSHSNSLQPHWQVNRHFWHQSLPWLIAIIGKREVGLDAGTTPSLKVRKMFFLPAWRDMRKGSSN